MKNFVTFISFFLLVYIPAGHGQSADTEVEALYDKFDQQETRRTEERVRKRRSRKKDPTVPSLSELSTLAPFSDIAVISRRFLPKTNRFEFSLGGMTSINNPFFNNLGLGFRGGYYLTEKWGLELAYFLLSRSQREVTGNLEDNQLVSTENLVSPKGYFGADLKWSPIYGKVAFMNKRIVPFDMFFSVGGGVTQTDASGNNPTLHLATGQIFALSKSMAFRWDLSWSVYQAEYEKTSGETATTNQDDLFVSLGVSFFFPEATYR